MGTSTPDTTPATNQGQVTLPAGWSAGPSRETTSTNQVGQIVQGIVVPISSITGATSTVFIPYDTLHQGAQAVQALFEQRISALSIIPGQSG